MVISPPEILRGDILLVDLEPTVGSEQMGTRPCIVVQNDFGNRTSPVTVVVPLTGAGKDKHYPFLGQIKKGDGGVKKDSYALANQIRVIDKSKILKNLGHLSNTGIIEVERAIRDELDL